MGTILRTKVIALAKKYADEGYTEGPNNWTIFAKILDDCGYFAPQKKQNVFWCHTFIDFLFFMCSDAEDDSAKKYDAYSYLAQPDYYNLSCGCVYGAGYFRSVGAFYDVEDAYIGDVIYFGKRGEEEHVGLIIDLDYDSHERIKTVYTVEGNKADAVRYCEYSVNDSSISGVGKPVHFDYYNELDTPVPEPPKPSPVKASFNCVDVSEYQGEVDWSQAKASGVEFAFIRCGLGKYYLLETDPVKRAEKQAKWEETQGEDKYFLINLENAIKAGIKVGVYFYSYATDWDSSVDEAQICMRIIEKYTKYIKFPVFYDVEEKANVPRIIDVVMGFVNTLNYYNYNVGVYTGGSWYSAYFKNISCDFIWLAFWGADDGKPHEKPDYCDIWQYSSHGTVEGIGENRVDVDILYNNEMTLLIHEPDPKPTEKVDVELNVLQKGSTGGQVNTIKALLNEFGFAEYLPLDGDFDKDTEQAVNRYKETYSLEVNGIVDAEMWNLILK
ncbi:MAG: peptidoglycan-binding protein [Clostridiales bacterium]|nr:peptidoglycan-binding protein [Clostridiales bacterium]